MKEEGKVIEISKGNVVIEIIPKEECTKCCSCNAAYPRRVTVSEEKTGGLSIGGHVEIEIDSSSMMKLYILLYAVPLLAFVATIFGLYIILKSPIISFIAALVATLLVYMLVGFYIRRNFHVSPDVCTKKS